MQDRTAAEVLQLVKDEGVEIVDFRFCDLPGLMQHFSVPAHELTEDVFEEGLGFDGSSIRGFQEIQESDMLLLPGPDTAVIDPFRQHKTLNLNCFVHDPVTLESLLPRPPLRRPRRPRRYLETTGIADTVLLRARGRVLHLQRRPLRPGPALRLLPGRLGRGHLEHRHATRSPNLGFKPRYKEGYFPVPPMDHFQDLRSEMILEMEQPRHRDRGAAPRGRHRPARPRSTCASTRCCVMADKLMLYKYVVKNVARNAGYTATFMPKPLFQDNGSGMHCHQSLWKDGEPLFYAETGYAGLSDMGRWYIGGLLKHAAAVLAFAAPTTNSYKRLVPGYEAPVNLVYSQRNRSAACRIPLYSKSPKAKRVEFRCPDPACNPYLAFSAMLMAGLDGVQNRIEPPDPWTRTSTTCRPKSWPRSPRCRHRWTRRSRALEADHDFLKAGGVFTDDLIETWIELQAAQRDRPRSGSARTRGSSCSTTTSRDFKLQFELGLGARACAGNDGGNVDRALGDYASSTTVLTANRG